MNIISKKNKNKYYNFLNSLPKKINHLYFVKLKKKLKINNKSKKKEKFDPVTNIDRSIELYLRQEITKKFPSDGIIGEEFQIKKSKSGFTWIIDPIDGTRSFIIGGPTWSNLISVSFKNTPTFGLANFPMLNKYYITGKNKSSLGVLFSNCFSILGISPWIKLSPFFLSSIETFLSR